MEEAVRGNSELRTYSCAEREAMDRLSRKVLKMSLDERYQPPGAYTGKKDSCQLRFVNNNEIHNGFSNDDVFQQTFIIDMKVLK